MLEIRNVEKRYGSVTAAAGISLVLRDGETAALLGPNGSGKSTLMKMVAGLVKPDRGTIYLAGSPIGPLSKKQICYMPTEGYFYNWMSAQDAGRYYADFFGDFSLIRYEELIAQESIDPRRRLRQLSSGMVAKVKLALAFARESRLTMLDEPLNGIDMLARERTIGLIKEHKGKRTMLVSTHLADEMEEMLDVLIFMKDGQVVLQGRREELCTQGRTLIDLYREIYGKEAQADA